MIGASLLYTSIFRREENDNGSHLVVGFDIFKHVYVTNDIRDFVVDLN
jgi:hypothetical protein